MIPLHDFAIKIYFKFQLAFYDNAKHMIFSVLL